MTTITSAETAVEFARQHGRTTVRAKTTLGQTTVEIVEFTKAGKTVSGVWSTAPDLKLPWHTYWGKGFFSSEKGADRMIDDMNSKDPKVPALANILAELV